MREHRRELLIGCVGSGTQLVWGKIGILYLCPEHCKLSVGSHIAHVSTAQETRAAFLFLGSVAFFIIIIKLTVLPEESLKTKDGC